MEIDQLIAALEETISFLQNSRSSAWTPMSVGEVIEGLDIEIGKVRDLKPVDERNLNYLFAPTGPIQETSIDNGWGDDFLKISDIVDQFTDK